MCIEPKFGEVAEGNCVMQVESGLKGDSSETVEIDDGGEEDGAGGGEEGADGIWPEPRLLSHEGRISCLLPSADDSKIAGTRERACGDGGVTETEDETEIVNNAGNGLEYTYLRLADESSMTSFCDSDVVVSTEMTDGGEVDELTVSLKITWWLLPGDDDK